MHAKQIQKETQTRYIESVSGDEEGKRVAWQYIWFDIILLFVKALIFFFFCPWLEWGSNVLLSFCYLFVWEQMVQGHATLTKQWVTPLQRAHQVFENITQWKIPETQIHAVCLACPSSLIWRFILVLNLI